MDEIVIHYIVETVYMVAGLAIGYLWRSLRTGHRDYGLIKEGVCALLRDRLLHKLEKCLEGATAQQKHGTTSIICSLSIRCSVGTGRSRR